MAWWTSTSVQDMCFNMSGSRDTHRIWRTVFKLDPWRGYVGEHNPTPVFSLNRDESFLSSPQNPFAPNLLSCKWPSSWVDQFPFAGCARYHFLQWINFLPRSKYIILNGKTGLKTIRWSYNICDRFLGGWGGGVLKTVGTLITVLWISWSCITKRP